MYGDDTRSRGVIRSVSAIALLCMAGCGTGGRPIVSISGDRLAAPVKQTFTRAFFATSDYGEDQVVAIDDPIDHTRERGSAGALEPLATPPVTQALAIRLHWRANGAAAGSPASMNAVLHWYAYGPESGANSGFVHYVGTGFVTLDPTTGGATVTVDRGTLKLADRVGSLRDPFGTFRIDGTFFAASDGRQLRQALDDVSAAESNARAAEHPTATTRRGLPAMGEPPTTVPSTLPAQLPPP